jgi:hypothetical protein
MYFSNPAGWNVVKRRTLEDAAGRLTGTRITAGDYAPLLSEPGADVLVYADPPYWRDTLLPKSGKLYEIGFTEADHIRFRDAVLKSPHRVVISYDDCEFKGGTANAATQVMLSVLGRPTTTRRMCLVVSFISKAELTQALTQLRNANQGRCQLIQLLWLVSSYIGACRDAGALPCIYCAP